MMVERRLVLAFRERIEGVSDKVSLPYWHGASAQGVTSCKLTTRLSWTLTWNDLSRSHTLLTVVFMTASTRFYGFSTEGDTGAAVYLVLGMLCDPGSSNDPLTAVRRCLKCY